MSTDRPEGVELRLAATGEDTSHDDRDFTVDTAWWRAHEHGVFVTVLGRTKTGEPTNKTYSLRLDALPDYIPRPPAEFHALAALVTGSVA